MWEPKEVAEDEPLPNDDRPLPFALIGDDAFALRTWLLKPHPHRGMTKEERIFNYRLSRARRVVENAFGILSNRFRCLLSTLLTTPDRVQKITMACCVLHNLLSLRNPRQVVAQVDHENPETHEVTPAAWREELGQQTLADLETLSGNTSSKQGKAVREYLAAYYNNVGAVEWQDRMI